MESFSGRPVQALAAAWMRRWPRVAGALPSAAEPGQRARLSRLRSLAPTCTQPSSPVTSPRPHFLAAAAAKLFPASTVAIAAPSLAEPPIRHHRSTTSSLVTHSLLPCPLIALGKRQRRAQAHRSPATNSVVVATPPQSTSCYASWCARFA